MSEVGPSALSDDATEFVDAFREDVGVFSDEATDGGAAWAQLEEAVEPAPSRTPLIWITAAAALAAAAVLVWVIGSATSMQSLEPDPGQQAPDRAATESAGVAPSRPTGVDSSRASRPEPQHPREPAAVPPASVQTPAKQRPPAAAPSPRSRPDKPAPAPAASRLAEELRLLDAMRAASKAGRHADALRMVAEHAAAFESGSFAAERELAKVRALCGLGRHAQVRAAQSRFAKSHPASHLASLVHSACPESAQEKQNPSHDE